MKILIGIVFAIAGLCCLGGVVKNKDKEDKESGQISGMCYVLMYVFFGLACMAWGIGAFK